MVQALQVHVAAAGVAFAGLTAAGLAEGTLRNDVIDGAVRRGFGGTGFAEDAPPSMTAFRLMQQMP